MAGSEEGEVEQIHGIKCTAYHALGLLAAEVSFGTLFWSIGLRFKDTEMEGTEYIYIDAGWSTVLHEDIDIGVCFAIGRMG